MSKYTISIKDIIYANKGDDDPTTLAGIHDIAERTLFGAELNVLNPEIVDRFITGLALHYFTDVRCGEVSKYNCLENTIHKVKPQAEDTRQYDRTNDA